MPGFVIGGQGSADLDEGIANTIETKRRHRWIFETIDGEPISAPMLLLLKSAQRPHYTAEVAELHHNQEVAKFAGKQTWEPITLTWYDGEQDPNVSVRAWNWLNTVVNISQVTVETPATYKRTATMSMLDGQGEPAERWQMFGVWPKEVNWSDVDYTNTEIQEFEVIFEYDRARLDFGAGDTPTN